MINESNGGAAGMFMQSMEIQSLLHEGLGKAISQQIRGTCHQRGRFIRCVTVHQISGVAVREFLGTRKTVRYCRVERGLAVSIFDFMLDFFQACTGGKSDFACTGGHAQSC